MNQVMNIPTELIDTEPQVRTKFKEETIAELAADIKAHGVLQPLVVQQNGERFTLLIGERRLRAIRYIGDMTAPAIIATVSTELAGEVQLMENIQREDLNTKDLAEAVKGLWKKHGSVAEVARRCNKSHSWVSKRLALALDVGIYTATLLDSNVKDVELLYNFAKLEKIDRKKALNLVPHILTGSIGRDEIKGALLENDEPPKMPTTDDLFPSKEQSDAHSAPIGPGASSKTPQNDADYANLRQQYALMYQALESIADMDKSLRPLQKADAMRKIARDTLNGFVSVFSTDYPD